MVSLLSTLLLSSHFCAHSDRVLTPTTFFAMCVQITFLCFAVVMIFVDCLTVQHFPDNEHGHPQYKDGLGERNAILAQLVSRLILMCVHFAGNTDSIMTPTATATTVVEPLLNEFFCTFGDVHEYICCCTVAPSMKMTLSNSDNTMLQACVLHCVDRDCIG